MVGAAMVPTNAAPHGAVLSCQAYNFDIGTVVGRTLCGILVWIAATTGGNETESHTILWSGGTLDASAEGYRGGDWHFGNGVAGPSPSRPAVDIGHCQKNVTTTFTNRRCKDTAEFQY